jgi:hypothetical protein
MVILTTVLNYAHIEKFVESGTDPKLPLLKMNMAYIILLSSKNPSIDSNVRKSLINLQVSKPLDGTGKELPKH